MLFAEKWMELEIMMLSKINQSLKYKYHTFSFICVTRGWIMDVEGRLLGKRMGMRIRNGGK
jgi:hypothetical protein